MKKVLLTENEYRKVCEILNESTIGKTVKIGDQVWMAENLAIDDDGEGIAYNVKNNEYYYTWDAAMRIAKSIPGWHLPTAKEWNEAALACGATESSSNPNRNKYGDIQELKDKLGVKLAGFYWGTFYNVGSDADFWTSDEYSSDDAYFYQFRNFHTGSYMFSNNDTKDFWYSVRLVKD